MCMAACVGTYRQWKLLLEEWRPIVEPLIPEGKHYHAKDSRYHEANLRLAELLLRRMDLIIAATIDKVEYHELTDNRFRGQWGGKPDALAAQGLLFFVADHCKQRGT